MLTPLEPQSRLGTKLLEIWLVCSQNGTAVLKGLRPEHAGERRLHPWTGLPILSRYSLVLTFVCCLLIEEEQLYSFRARRRLRPRSCLSGKPLVFHRRYAFQVLQIRSQCLNPGNYRAFNLIHTNQYHFMSCIITRFETSQNRKAAKKTERESDSSYLEFKMDNIRNCSLISKTSWNIFSEPEYGSKAVNNNSIGQNWARYS